MRRRNHTYAAQRKRRSRRIGLGIIALLLALTIFTAFWVRTSKMSVALPVDAVSDPSQIAVVPEHVIFELIPKSHIVTLAAFSLSSNARVVKVLEDAADHGEHVSVALSRGFGLYVEENEDAAADLRSHGIRVHILESTTASTHLKAAILDGRLFLSDRNWSNDPAHEIVVADSIPGDRELIEKAILGDPGRNNHLWTLKSEALQAEASLIDDRQTSRLRISSESFGPNTPVYSAIEKRCEQGDRVELLVATTEYSRSRIEREAIERLIGLGVHVRLAFFDEKFFVDGNDSWIGSANATHGAPQQVEFGLISREPAVAVALARQFDAEFENATDLR